MVVWDLLVKYKEGNLSYKESVALFFTIWPEKQHLKSVFEHQDAVSRKKLNTELLKKYQELAEHQQKNDFKTFTQPAKAPIRLEMLPEELRTAYHRNVQITKEIAYLRGKLFALQTPEERYPIADRIVSLAAERTANYRQIDEFVEKGCYTKKEEIVHTRIDPTIPKNYQIEYELKLLRSRRTKLRSNPARLDEYNAVVKKINELEKQRYA